jgi:uncharacterized membrane protein YfcA
MSSSIPLLSFLIAVIAFLYSSIGFGGSTGYLAVMSFFEIEPNLMATTALLLNVVVSGIAFFNYMRAGHIEKHLLLLFPVASIPAAFIGGYFKLNKELYFVVLYIILTYVMIRMLFTNTKQEEAHSPQAPPIWLALLSGATIGLLSGMVGMGGGIILSPLIIMLHWGTPKQAASTAAGFIFLNSLSGLLGRALGGNFVFGQLGAWLLPIGVVGALAGSYFGAHRFSSLWGRRVLGVVLLVAVVKFWVGYF